MTLTLEQKARRAKEILEDEVMQEAIEATKQQYVAEWALTDFEDSQTRELKFLQHRLLDDVFRKLRSFVDDWTITQNRQSNARDL
jgi:hypothetical protein|tara:strand:+ start:773 stop:1027 length:255 start_codon:yes stop_codon:yes gene_type:complete